MNQQKAIWVNMYHKPKSRVGGGRALLKLEKEWFLLSSLASVSQALLHARSTEHKNDQSPGSIPAFEGLTV